MDKIFKIDGCTNIFVLDFIYTYPRRLINDADIYKAKQSRKRNKKKRVLRDKPVRAEYIFYDSRFKCAGEEIFHKRKRQVLGFPKLKTTCWNFILCLGKIYSKWQTALWIYKLLWGRFILSMDTLTEAKRKQTHSLFAVKEMKANGLFVIV